MEVARLTYKVAFFADTHIGYATRCRVNPETGFNERVADGYRGLRDTITDIINNEVDVVVQGGDLFHRSLPNVTDVVWVRQQLNRLYEAKIPFYGNTGNHDFANERGKYPATSAVEDVDKNIHILTKPHHIYKLTDGVNLISVSHAGVIASEKYVPEPIPGEVSLFTTHGAAAVPGHEMFACADSPGEAVIPYEFLTNTWDVTLLGHYHQMGPLPGFDTGKNGQAWYAGSLLRRGFSDKEGGRGWLLITINDGGDVVIERKTLPQRPQLDLPTVDASHMTVSEVEEVIMSNITNHDMANAIVRQRVINIAPGTRRALDTKYLKSLTQNTLVWQLEFFRPAEVETFAALGESENVVTSLATAKVSDMPAMWKTWLPQHAEDFKIAPENITTIEKLGENFLKNVEEI